MILTEEIFDEIEKSENIPDVETPPIEVSEIQPETPKEGADMGIANLIHDLIIDENEAIQGYNNAVANMEDYPELQKIMQDIAGEELLALAAAMEKLSEDEIWEKFDGERPVEAYLAWQRYHRPKG